MTECMICQYDDEASDDDGPEVYVVEKPRGTMTICEHCDAQPYRCRACENRWLYGGNADRPTCPECRGKAVEQLASD